MNYRFMRYRRAIMMLCALVMSAGLLMPRGSEAQQAPAKQPEVTPFAFAGSTIFALASGTGLGAQPQRLITFDLSSPGTLRSDERITGMQPGEMLRGIDFRPATGQLYGLGTTSRLYLLDPVTAVATAVGGAPFTPVINSVAFFGFDFNPVPDRIRTIENVNDQNLRLNPNTGAVAATDPNVFYATGDPNAGSLPNIVAEAYSNNVAGTTSTTNFAIDAPPDGPARLVTLGTRDFPNAPPGGGASVSPNTGQLFTVGSLGFRTNNFAGFDIAADSGTAYVALTPENPFNASSSLYTLNLSTGAATLVGVIGGNVKVESITLALRNISTTTIQFSVASATYTVAEGANSLAVTINRTGDTTGPATVEFQTDDTGEGIRCDTISGSAFARCDYATAFETLTFAPGETSKTVNIFIADDGFAEGDETFTISLRNASASASLNPQQSVATVTITDNDTANATTNPIDTPEFFVRQLYIDFLSREPDTAGFNSFVNLLRNCPANDIRCDRIAVASAFSRSNEYLLFKGYYSFRFYRAAFGRRPSYQEFTQDLQRLTGTSSEDVIARQAAFADEFTRREEFRARYADLSNRDYIVRLYQTANITLTSTEMDQIVAALNSGSRSRAQVLRDLIERRDFFDREFNNGLIASQYFGFLRRDPDEPGFQNFLRILNTNPGDFRTVVANFVNSVEYRLRFGRQ